MKRKINMAVLIGMLFIAVSLQASEMQVVIDENPIQMEETPFIEGGTTFVPLRVISEELGAEVVYIPENKGIVIRKATKYMVMQIDNPNVQIGEEVVALKSAPRLIGNTAMVPIRLISENLDCKVGWDAPTQKITITNQLPVVTMAIKGMGTIEAELYPYVAPNTVNNFISLVNKDFYDGLTFHRVIENFMIQGGCPEGTGIGGPGYSIEGEFLLNGKLNLLPHTEGILSMARSMEPNSAGSQFFIMTSVSEHLDGEYAAFGKVTKGMDIVKAIEEAATDANDQPQAPIIIEEMTVDTKGITYDEPVRIEG